MSTFLELSQKTRRESGAGGTGPSTVTGQSGQLEKMVNWVADSYTDIQLRCPNWRWMRTGFTVTTTASVGTYAYTACTDSKTAAAIARFASWWAHDRLNPFKCHLTSAGVSGQYRLIWMPYEDWRRIYEFGVQQSTTGQPAFVSVDNDDRIVLGPKPDAIYTVTGEFQRGPQTLAADGDTPDMPTRFHDLIVWHALTRYAVNAVAPEVLTYGKMLSDRMMRELEQAQMPTFRMAGPLA